MRWREEGTGGSAEPEERTGYGRWDEARTPREEVDPGPRPRDGSAGPPGTDADLVCDLCGGAMIERHCKILCLRCGYQRDCSDP